MDFFDLTSFVTEKEKLEAFEKLDCSVFSYTHQAAIWVLENDMRIKVLHDTASTFEGFTSINTEGEKKLLETIGELIQNDLVSWVEDHTSNHGEVYLGLTKFGINVLNQCMYLEELRPNPLHPNNYNPNIKNIIINIEYNGDFIDGIVVDNILECEIYRSKYYYDFYQCMRYGFIAIKPDGGFMVTKGGFEFMDIANSDKITIKCANFADELSTLLAKYDASIMGDGLTLNVKGTNLPVHATVYHDFFESISARNIRKMRSHTKVI